MTEKPNEKLEVVENNIFSRKQACSVKTLGAHTVYLDHIGKRYVENNIFFRKTACAKVEKAAIQHRHATKFKRTST